MRRWLSSLLYPAVLVVLCGCPVRPDPVPGPEPEPTPVVIPEPGPSVPDFAKSVEYVNDKRIAEFYSDFADVIKRDNGIVTTTGQFRTAYTRAGALMFQETDTKGKYPNLATEIDAILAARLGLDDVQFDRAVLVETLEGIGKACQ